MKPPAHKHSQAESNGAQDDMQLYRLTGNYKVNKSIIQITIQGISVR